MRDDWADGHSCILLANVGIVFKSWKTHAKKRECVAAVTVNESVLNNVDWTVTHGSEPILSGYQSMQSSVHAAHHPLWGRNAISRGKGKDN